MQWLVDGNQRHQPLTLYLTAKRRQTLSVTALQSPADLAHRAQCWRARDCCAQMPGESAEIAGGGGGAPRRVVPGPGPFKAPTSAPLRQRRACAITSGWNHAPSLALVDPADPRAPQTSDTPPPPHHHHHHHLIEPLPKCKEQHRGMWQRSGQRCKTCTEKFRGGTFDTI